MTTGYPVPYSPLPCSSEAQQMFVFAHFAPGMGISSYKPVMLFVFPPNWNSWQLQSAGLEG